MGSHINSIDAVDEAVAIHAARAFSQKVLGFAPPGMTPWANRSVLDFIYETPDVPDINEALKALSSRRKVKGSDDVVRKITALPCMLFHRQLGFGNQDLFDAINDYDGSTFDIGNKSSKMSIINGRFSYDVMFIARDRASVEWMARVWASARAKTPSLGVDFTIGGVSLEAPAEYLTPKTFDFAPFSIPERKMYALVTTVEVRIPLIEMQLENNPPSPVRIEISFEVLP